MDLEEISKSIDAGGNPHDIRVALGAKITECLVARSDQLSPWERVNFGIAIELLPSPWLRMTHAHVDSVCSPDFLNPKREAAESQPVPTLSELHAMLAEALAVIDQQRFETTESKTSG